MAHSPNTPSHRDRHPRWLGLAGLSAAFVAGGLTLPALTASAQGAAASMSAMPGHGTMHAMGMAHMQQMLDQAGASANQKARITAILHTGFAPMMGMHTEMQRAHASLHALLTAPTIDRAALEQLRSREIAGIDAATRQMVKAMADAAEVLTPAQRAKLAQMGAKAGPPM